MKFDAAGDMYVADYENKRVQVLDASGRFLREFYEVDNTRFPSPSGLLIADKFIYVSDAKHQRVVVYETSGQYVTWFGERGVREGEFQYPCCITSCLDGFIHVCDCFNNRVQIFY